MDKTPSKKSGFGLTAIITVLSALILLAIGGYFVYQRLVKPANIGGIACTQEAKLCQDGSYVSRTGPNCEFAECPAPTPPQKSEIDISTWKTYRNEKYGYQMKYPSGYFIIESVDGHEVAFYTSKQVFDQGISPVFVISLDRLKFNQGFTDFLKDVSAVNEKFVKFETSQGGLPFVRWSESKDIDEFTPISYSTIYKAQFVLTLSAKSPTYGISSEFMSIVSSLE